LPEPAFPPGRHEAPAHGNQFSFAGGVEGIYNRADFLEQRRELLEKWADYCAASEPKTANVVPLKRPRLDIN